MDTAVASARKIETVFQGQQKNAATLARTSYRQRIGKLKKIADYISDPKNEGKLLQALYQDLGRPEPEAYAGEIAVTLIEIKFLIKNLRRLLKPRKVATPLSLQGATSYIHYESKGCSLIISPWNYPFQLAVNPLVYALAAGNPVIIKPSEYAIATAQYLEEMITTLFPADEVCVIQGAVETSQILLDLPFRHIYFTGSPAVGKIVMSAAARHLASITLELGGKSPCIVDDTSDVKKAAESILWGKCYNTSQTCIAPDYIMVHHSAYDSLVEHLIKTCEYRYNQNGKGIETSPDLGRIISERHHHRAKNLLEDALSKGAEVLYGGHYRDEERFFAPTFVGKVTRDMLVMQEEIFSPILPIIPFKDKDEVISQIRSLPKPLSMYIFSGKQKNIDYYLQNSSAGGTVINDCLIHYANHNLPFGGVNNSGIGKAHGEYGLYNFMNERAVMHQKWGTTKVLHPPYSGTTMKILRFLGKYLS